MLRNARVIDSRRDGSWVYYFLTKQENADCERLLRELVRGFTKRDVLRRDLENLVKVRRPKACD